MKLLGPIVRSSFTIMILCGLIYPVAMTGVAQTVMPDKADGSLIYDENGNVLGSELIGQHVTNPAFFHGRVSAIEYDGGGSGSNNYAPSNQDMIQRTKESVDSWVEQNPDTPISEVPIDLLTDSASGLDPHISPKGAQAQVKRIASLSGVPEETLEALIEKHIEKKELGLFGEERVNVLLLNLDLLEIVE